MKVLLLIISIIFPVFAFSQSTFIDSDKYTQFPKEYLEQENLIQHIIPDKKYTYWELVYVDGDLDQYGKVLFSNGKKPPETNFKNPIGGFTWDCPPGICFKFIAYVYDGKIGYVNSVDSLIKFLGSIDNLQEATLLSEVADGYTVHPLYISRQKIGGAYLKTKEGYEIVLTSMETCPVSDEAIKITVDKKGIVKKQSLGVYYKSTDCYHI